MASHKSDSKSVHDHKNAASAAMDAAAAADKQAVSSGGSGGGGDEEVDINSADLHTLKHMIEELPPSTRGMTPKQQQEHLARVDALMSAYQRAARQELFRMQQQKKQFLAFLKANYTPKHPHLYELKGWKFQSKFLAAVTSTDKAEKLKLLQSVGPAAAADSKSGGSVSTSSPVYVFDMLEADTCRELCEEVRHYENWMNSNKHKIERPNTMNKYGVVLDDIGFAPCLRQLMHTYITPLSTLVYGDTGGSELDAHHGFIVEYEMSGDRKLDLHVDDSEVTLNLSLGEVFTGGGLEFAGARCSYHQGTEPDLKAGEVFKVEHSTGHAYLHRGKHRHQATPITAGHRLNLIVWCISTNYRELEGEQPICPSWCGYHEKGQAMGGADAPPTKHVKPSGFMCGDGSESGSGGGGGKSFPPQHQHAHDSDYEDDEFHVHTAACKHNHSGSGSAAAGSNGSK